MALGCGAKVLKYCLFAFNLIFFIAGVLCLGIGIYLIVDDHALARLAKVKDTNDQPIINESTNAMAVHHLGVIMAVGGAIILVIAFLGCCGAVKEWRPLLVLYAICLMIILAIEIAAAIYAAINRKNLESDIKKIMAAVLERYNGTNSDPSEPPNAARSAWDKLMNDTKCCGVNNTADNSSDFSETGWFKDIFLPRYDGDLKEAKKYYPQACCKTPELVVGNPKWVNPNDPVCTHRYEEGCYDKLKNLVESKLAIVIGVGVGVGIIQLIGIIFAFCLCRAITDEYVG